MVGGIHPLYTVFGRRQPERVPGICLGRYACPEIMEYGDVITATSDPDGEEYESVYWFDPEKKIEGSHFRWVRGSKNRGEWKGEAA